MGAALSVIYVVYSGYLFMSSQGDPQRMAQARTSLIGVAVGLVIIGGAFIIPTTISRYVIEPAGGVRVEPRAGADCDGLLKDQLVVQRTVGAPDKMQFLISKIQGRRDECSLDLWSPVVRDRAGRPVLSKRLLEQVERVDSRVSVIKAVVFFAMDAQKVNSESWSFFLPSRGDLFLIGTFAWIRR